MAEEVRHTIEIAAAEICVYDEICNGAQFQFANTNGIASKCSSYTNLKNSVEDVYSSKTFDIKSKFYKSKTYTVTVAPASSSAAGTGAALTVTGAWN
ncbi:MAG: hypothetical protein J5643_06600 [Lachnospiraceae bacterium]|nr:hypothetical protein [Lachnospiraceae bacterium]